MAVPPADLAAIAESAGKRLFQELDAKTQRADHATRGVDHIVKEVGVIRNKNSGAAQSANGAAIGNPAGEVADIENCDRTEAAADDGTAANKKAFVDYSAGKTETAENVDCGKLRADNPAGAIDHPTAEARHGINQDTRVGNAAAGCIRVTE